MPRKKVEVSEGGKKAARSFKNRARRSKRRASSDNFDWSTITKPTDTDVQSYVHRCSVKCSRASENPPLTPSGTGCFHQFKTAEGKLRWMCSFKKRSELQDMLLDSKELNGRKARKEMRR